MRDKGNNIEQIKTNGLVLLQMQKTYFSLQPLHLEGRPSNLICGNLVHCSSRIAGELSPKHTTLRLGEASLEIFPPDHAEGPNNLKM